MSDSSIAEPVSLRTHSIEILDPGSGLFVSLTAGGNGAVMLDGEVIAASPIPSGGLDGLREGEPLGLQTERGELEIDIQPAGEPIRMSGDLIGRREARLIEVSGKLVEGDRTIKLDCSGVLHARDESRAAAGVRRDLTVILADGGLLCAAAAAPAGSDRPDREETVAAISHPGGYIEFEEMLLSTEYDAAGRQHRATLELWPDTDQIAPLHGAGSAITGCTVKTSTGEISTALFQWSLDGHHGQGRYEVTRPPANGRHERETVPTLKRDSNETEGVT